MAQTEKAHLIQLVKIGQKQLDMDDESYRAMLKRLTNKISATKCTLVELHKVIHELQQKGAKIRWFPRKGMQATDYSPVSGSQPVKSDIVHKIRAVWINMGKDGFLADRSEQALVKTIRTMLNRGRQKQGKTLLLVHLHTLNQPQAIRVLEALKSWHKREMVQHLENRCWITDKKTGKYLNLRKTSYDYVCNLYAEWKYKL